MHKHVFFDLDGTITDSQLGILNSFKYTLNKLNKPCDESKLKLILGPPLALGFSIFGLNENEIPEAVSIYRERYQKTGMLDENKLYPGIEQMLAALTDKRYKLSIVTNKPTVSAKRIIEHFKISNYFSGIYGADLSEKDVKKINILNTAIKEENTTHKNVVMVGDRMYDLEAALLAGVDAIGVLYGYGEKEELENYPTLFLAPGVKELMDFLLCYSE